MSALLLTPVVLSCVVLAAHVLRVGIPLLPWAVLFAPLLLVTRQPWAARLLQIMLVLGGLEWIRTTVNLVRLRMALEEPWERMVLILVGVTVVTLASALALQHRSFRRPAAKG